MNRIFVRGESAHQIIATLSCQILWATFRKMMAMGAIWIRSSWLGVRYCISSKDLCNFQGGVCRMPIAKQDPQPFSLIIHCHHRWNWSRYLVAASTASSTFSGCGPLLTHVDPFPTAFPPTTLATLLAHSLAERPALVASYNLC